MFKSVRRIARLTVRILATGSVVLTGCTAVVAPADDNDPLGVGSKEDRWDATSDPANFSTLNLKYKLADLPQEGRSARPAWPSTYWPTYMDSINDRWDSSSELSPAEKYDRAFNNWTPPEGFMNLRPFNPNDCAGGFDAAYYEQLGPLAMYISDYMGNKDSRDGVDSDGDNKVDCDDDDNDGVESWFGLCHAWVPAAMLEDRPIRPVTYNGVTFYSGDLEALLIAAYNRNNAEMIGGRCNDGHGVDGRPGETVERDEHGRAIASDCRDTNPGAWHVIVANYLGIGQRPFAEDRTYDFQVWNQPVVAYTIDSMEEIDIARANELLSLTGDTYQYNPDAKKLFYVAATSTYISESSASRTPADPADHESTDNYTYILELDADGNIIGGEWVDYSRSNHPDFLWNPFQRTRSAVPSLDIDKIRMLIQQSREEQPAPVGGREFPGQGGIVIPDNDPAGITSSVEVPEAITIGDLQVAIEIQHTYTADLTVKLVRGNDTLTLLNQEGGSADNVSRVLPVPQFNGQSAQGTWNLVVVDSADQDSGTLVSWKLIVTPAS